MMRKKWLKKLELTLEDFEDLDGEDLEVEIERKKIYVAS